MNTYTAMRRDPSLPFAPSLIIIHTEYHPDPHFFLEPFELSPSGVASRFKQAGPWGIAAGLYMADV